MSEVPNSINLVGGFGLGGWGDSGYVFPPTCEDEPERISILSKTCVDEQILNSQFSSPSFSNYSPQDTEPCSSCKYKVESCDARNCILCKQIRKTHYFSSTVTGRKYHVRTSKDLNCNSCNLIYLLQTSIHW